jgi:hypothetical protein
MNISAVIDAISKHAWVLVASLVIGALVRALKSDTPLPTVPPKWRAWLALGLGIVAGVLDKILGGTPWLAAILGGIAAAMAAIVGHETVVESLRNGRDIFVPKSKPTSPKALAKIVPPAVLLSVALFVCSLIGCAWFQTRESQVVHGVADVTDCVLAHDSEPPEEIVTRCGGVAVEDVVKILDAQKRTEARHLAAKHDAGVSE